MKKGYLVLEDGQVFEGHPFGAPVDAVGELVFHTGVVGYVETLTDSACMGQIVICPLVGGVGMIYADAEGPCRARGIVTREFCPTPSNFRTDCDFDAYLKEAGIPGLWGVDTRELICILRETGGMNAMLCETIPTDLTPIKTYTIANGAAEASCNTPETFPAEGQEQLRISVLDCGVNRSIVENLRRRGCTVTVLPVGTSAQEILDGRPDGVLVSNGPGYPAENPALLKTVSDLMGNVPMLGIGLGHQLMALAAGGTVIKMPCGHRGGNQPVRDLKGGRTYVTKQNHGYTVKHPGSGSVSFENLNDGSCEGLDYPGKRALSVQFFPDAVGDSAVVYERFVDLMKGGEL